MEYLYLGPLPYYIDAEVFFAVVWALWEPYIPRKSGHMASTCDYEVYGQEGYFYTTCVYSHYQDTVTRYAGWFEDELRATYNKVLANWRYYVGEEEANNED